MPENSLRSHLRPCLQNRARSLWAGATFSARAETETSGLATVRVGTDAGDFRGNDQRVLQAAVDYVARLGRGYGVDRAGPI